MINVNLKALPYFEVKIDHEGPQYNDYKGLIDFLNNNVESYKSPNTTSSIIVADDQFVNQQGIRLNFMDIGFDSRLKMFSNGEEVLKYFEKIFERV